MRLNELFDGGITKDIKKWLSDFTVTAGMKHDYTDVDVDKPSLMADKDGELLDTIASLKLEAKSPKNFYWPLHSTKPLGEFTLTLRPDVILDGFDHFPKVQRLNFEGARVKSLKGINEVNSIQLIEFIGAVKFDCGVLQLLKYHGKELWAHKLDDEKLEKALHIVMRYRDGNRDVIECQNALIDAGLEEFAKQ